VDFWEKTITIKYNEDILKEPGIKVHFDNVTKRLIPLIKDDLKKES
jgi:hypothetical protein